MSDQKNPPMPLVNESDIADDAVACVLNELFAHGIIPPQAMVRTVLVAKARLASIQRERGWPKCSEEYATALKARVEVALAGLMTPVPTRDPETGSYRDLFGQLFGLPPRADDTKH